MKDYDATYHNLLQLLSFSLFDNAPRFKEPLDVEAIFKEGIKQKVFPLVFTATKSMFDNKVSTYWQNTFDKHIAANLRIFSDHLKFNKNLKQNNFKFAILKGATSAQYYPNPVLRSMGDIDFLVRNEDIEIISEKLCNLGYTKQDNKVNKHHICFKNKKQTSFELHWQPAGIPKNKDIEDILLNINKKALENVVDVELLTESICAPDALFHGLTLLLHTVEHLYKSGIGLRHLCDWAVFINTFDSYEFTKTFENLLKSIGLWDFCCCLTFICTKYLGCKDFDWAVYDQDVANNLLLDIFKSGDFAIKDLSRLNQAKFFGFYFDNENSKVKFINVFKSMRAKAIEQYPICKKNKALITFFALKIVFAHILKTQLGRKPKIRIIKNFIGAVERHKIYEKLNIYIK